MRTGLPMPTGYYANAATHGDDQTTYGNLYDYGHVGWSNASSFRIEAQLAPFARHGVPVLLRDDERLSGGWGVGVRANRLVALGVFARRRPRGSRGAQPLAELPAHHRHPQAPAALELGDGPAVRTRPEIRRQRRPVPESGDRRLADRRHSKDVLSQGLHSRIRFFVSGPARSALFEDIAEFFYVIGSGHSRVATACTETSPLLSLNTFEAIRWDGWQARSRHRIKIVPRRRNLAADPTS